MRGKRLMWTIRLWLTPSARKRTDYLRKKQIFANIGNKSLIMNRTVPLYSRLISIGENVHIASNVHFVTHDISHVMLNNLPNEMISGHKFQEKIGCIEIGDNVFIGAGTRIIYDVQIGNNCIIGADSLVTKDIPDSSVVAGIPAKRISSIDEFISKRGKEPPYVGGVKPCKEKVPEILVSSLWLQFNERRQK